MGEICCGVAGTYGGKIDLNYQYGYPPTVNSHPECVEVVINAATKIVGKNRSSLPQKTMGAEDFSYFMEIRPGTKKIFNSFLLINFTNIIYYCLGCFFFVGAALPGEQRPHHKSVFDFDENALLVSTSMFVQIIRDLLY